MQLNKISAITIVVLLFCVGYTIPVKGQDAKMYISVEGGASLFFGNEDAKIGLFDYRITPTFKLSVGGDFKHWIGMRGQFSAGSLRGVSSAPQGTIYFSNTPVNGIEKYTQTPIYYQQAEKNGLLIQNGIDRPYYFQDMAHFAFSTDVMFHLVNLISNTNFHHIVEVSPHVGFLMNITAEYLMVPSTFTFGLQGGIMTSFRLGRSIDLFLDFNGHLVPDIFDGELHKTTFDAYLNASLGIRFKINKKRVCVNCETTSPY